MAQNFTQRIHFDGRTALAVIVPSLKRDGMSYEVNVQGFPRFLMAWSALDRYDVVGRRDARIPDSLVLAVSDAIEASAHK
jgi:hypothetical protein